MAVASMTGFGIGSAEDGGERIDVELRSVNGKFCEVKPRLPRELAALEVDFVKLIKERLARGNIDANVKRKSVGALPAAPKVNAQLVAAYASELRAAARVAGLDDSLALRDLIDLEGVVHLEEHAPDLAASGRALTAATGQALAALTAVRNREGAALEADLRGRSANIRRIAGQLETAGAASVVAYRDKLRARLAELSGNVQFDAARLEQEAILFADRSDVAEELTRLRAHVDEMDRLLSQKGPSGRQLDFLAQEMHREANTTGSKSQSSEVSRLVVELKTEIERAREQVQNVE